MFSEHDLRAAITELADEGHPTRVAEQVLTTGRACTAGQVPVRDTVTPLPRRVARLLPAGTAVAAVAAVVTVGVAIASVRHQNRPVPAVATSSVHNSRSRVAVVTATPTVPCATVRTPPFDTFTVAPVPGIDADLTDATACAGFETRNYFRTGGGEFGRITVYRPGVFDAAQVHGATPVVGDGIRGFYLAKLPGPPGFGQCRYVLPETTKPVCTHLPAGIAWQYAPHAWATITSFDDPLAILLAVAAAVRPDRTTSLVSPFQISDLAGLEPVTAETITTGPRHTALNHSGANLYLDYPDHSPGCPPTLACTHAVSIEVDSTDASATAPLGKFTGRHTRPVRIGPWTGLLIPATAKDPIGAADPRELRFQTGHWFILVTVQNGYAGITDDQLLTLARTMTFTANTTDPTTWYPFNAALPH